VSCEHRLPCFRPSRAPTRCIDRCSMTRGPLCMHGPMMYNRLRTEWWPVYPKKLRAPNNRLIIQARAIPIYSSALLVSVQPERHTCTLSPKAEQGRSSIPTPADTCVPTQSVPPDAASASASKKFGWGCSRQNRAGGKGSRNPMRRPFIMEEYIPSVVATY
jgi:hypothetical protein